MSTAPIVITGQVVGADVVTVHLARAAGVAHERLSKVVPALGFTLENKVKHVYLAGRALNKRSGRLQRSVNTRITDTAQQVVATVGTKNKYGIHWERGGVIPAHDIFPKNAKALFWPGAAHPVAHVHMPARTDAARPFLRPASEDMRGQVTSELAHAVQGL